MKEAEVAGEEGITITQGTQRDVVSGPWTDPGQHEQLAARLHPVDIGIEHQLTVRERAGEGLQRPAARAGHPQSLRIRLGERSGGREQVGHASNRPWKLFSVLGDEPRSQGGGSRDRHLLTEHCPHGQLVGIDATGDPNAWASAHEATDQLIRLERVEPCPRIRVEVEQEPGALDRLCLISGILKPEPLIEVRLPWLELENRRAACQSKASPVAALGQLLHTGDGAASQEVEQAVAVERFAVGESDCGYRS